MLVCKETWETYAPQVSVLVCLFLNLLHMIHILRLPKILSYSTKHHVISSTKMSNNIYKCIYSFELSWPRESSQKEKELYFLTNFSTINTEKEILKSEKSVQSTRVLNQALLSVFAWRILPLRNKYLMKEIELIHSLRSCLQISWKELLSHSIS